MLNTRRASLAPQGRWLGRAVTAAALVMAVSLGGCANGSDFTAASDTPYQVAGPVVARGPVAQGPVNSYYQDCANGQTFVDNCSGFPRSYLP